MNDEEEIDLSKVKDFFMNMDWRDTVIILLCVLLMTMYIISTRDITMCNNYWLDIIKTESLSGFTPCNPLDFTP